MSSLETSSPVSASTFAYLMRWPVFLLIWLKWIFSESVVAGYRATGQVTRERRKKPFQLARGAIVGTPERNAGKTGVSTIKKVLGSRPGALPQPFPKLGSGVSTYLSVRNRSMKAIALTAILLNVSLAPEIVRNTAQQVASWQLSHFHEVPQAPETDWTRAAF